MECGAARTWSVSGRVDMVVRVIVTGATLALARCPGPHSCQWYMLHRPIATEWWTLSSIHTQYNCLLLHHHYNINVLPPSPVVQPVVAIPVGEVPEDLDGEVAGEAGSGEEAGQGEPGERPPAVPHLDLHSSLCCCCCCCCCCCGAVD